MWFSVPAYFCLSLVASTFAVSPEAEDAPIVTKTISLEKWDARDEITYLNPAPNYTDVAPNTTPDWSCRYLLPSWSDGQGKFPRSSGSLTIYQMSDNEFPPHIFYHFCSCFQLTLANQHLKQIEAMDFENAKHLNVLNLSGNEIERIEANVFQNAIKLKEINLSKNLIEFIDEQAFNYSIHRRIYLGSNRLTTFESQWQQLDDVLYRFIWNNNWTYVVETVAKRHWGIPSLIDLSNNPLVSSSEPIRLKADRMDLRNNDLKWVPIYAQTTKLDAQNNSISEIVLEVGDQGELSSNGSWSSWSGFQLTELNLSNNSFTSVPLELANLTALQIIDLSHNLIETLPRNVLSQLNDLKWISLNNNQLKNVNFGAVLNTLTLEYLDVSNNNLGSFRLNRIFPELTELQINHNNLTVLDSNIKRRAPKLKRVGLSGNNWNCDHLVDALQAIPFDQIEVDTSSSFLNGNGINDGHVLGITCLEVDDAGDAVQQSVSSLKADLHLIIKAEVGELLKKFDEMNKKFETLSNVFNNNV